MIPQGQKMKIDGGALTSLAERLLQERKRQGLTREQAASVCNVSASFIRDAESDPGRCSLDRLLHLTQGLGLTLTLTGWESEAPRPTATGLAAPP